MAPLAVSYLTQVTPIPLSKTVDPDPGGNFYEKKEVNKDCRAIFVFINSLSLYRLICYKFCKAGSESAFKKLLDPH